MEPETVDLEKDYPSIPLAYQIALNSYEVLIKRLDVLDGRIQSMITFSTTVIAAFVSIAGARGVQFDSGWIWAAGMVFALSMVIALAVRLIGSIQVIDPGALWNTWLDLPPIEFQKNLIFDTRVAFEQNLALGVLRQRYLAVLTGLLALEVILLVVWVAVAS